jgi:hypothetical protein
MEIAVHIRVIKALTNVIVGILVSHAAKITNAALVNVPLKQTLVFKKGKNFNTMPSLRH